MTMKMLATGNQRTSPLRDCVVFAVDLGSPGFALVRDDHQLQSQQQLNAKPPVLLLRPRVQACAVVDAKAKARVAKVHHQRDPERATCRRQRDRERATCRPAQGDVVAREAKARVAASEKLPQCQVALPQARTGYLKSSSLESCSQPAY